MAILREFKFFFPLLKFEFKNFERVLFIKLRETCHGREYIISWESQRELSKSHEWIREYFGEKSN